MVIVPISPSLQQLPLSMKPVTVISQLLAPVSATPVQQYSAQPPPATDSGKEEVEVKDKLEDLAPVLAVALTQAKATTRQLPAVQLVQPAHQSTHTVPANPLLMFNRIRLGKGLQMGTSLHLWTCWWMMLITSLICHHLKSHLRMITISIILPILQAYLLF